jgi:hypothetical protein
MGLRVGLDAVENRKILPCRGSNPGRPARRCTKLSTRTGFLLNIIALQIHLVLQRGLLKRYMSMYEGGAVMREVSSSLHTRQTT